MEQKRERKEHAKIQNKNKRKQIVKGILATGR